MALINVTGRRIDDDPLTAMFQGMPPSAQLPQAGPPPATTQQQSPLVPEVAQPEAYKAPTTNMARPDPDTGVPPPPRAPAQASTAPFTFDQLNALYQQYLGRGASQDEYANWANGTYGPPNLPSIQQQIQNSGEAQAYRVAHPSNGGGGGATENWNTGAWDAGRVSRYFASRGVAARPDSPAYWEAKWNEWGKNDPAYFFQRLSTAEEFGGGGGGGGGSAPPPTSQPYGGTNIFDDPATANFEKLLNDLITRFNTSATPPHYQQAIDQLNAYLAKLNGPVYTPAEMELMQTQAWDPMQQQRDAAKQQLIQRLGAQGISPSSGIFERALEDLDRQFQQAHTTQQGQFSNQAIGLSRQNAATAATLAPQISALEQAQTSWQDQRSLQAELLAALIPQMASQRLRDANGAMSPINISSLFQQLQSFQNQGYGQGANYGSAIMQLLAQLFGVGG